MNESPLYTRTYDFLLWIIPHAQQFPRPHRFGLSERVTRRALDFQETVIAAGVQKGPERKALLQRADVQLAQLRHLLRLCKDLKLLSLNQYEHVAGLLVEIGKLLGSWRKGA